MRYLIHHKTWGVFLGRRGPECVWSKVNRHDGVPGAWTYELEATAWGLVNEYVRLNESVSSDDFEVFGVVPGFGVYATREQVQALGLDIWTDPVLDPVTEVN